MDRVHTRTAVAYLDPREAFWERLLSVLKGVLSPSGLQQILADYAKAKRENTDESLVSLARSICAVLSWLRPQILEQGAHSSLLKVSMELDSMLSEILPKTYDPKEFKKACQEELSRKIALTDAITQNRAERQKAELAISKVAQDALEAMQDSIAASEKLLEDCIALAQGMESQQDHLYQQQRETDAKITQLKTDAQAVQAQVEGTFKKAEGLS